MQVLIFCVLGLALSVASIDFNELAGHIKNTIREVFVSGGNQELGFEKSNDLIKDDFRKG